MSKKSRSKTWFLVHSWLALPIWFFVFLVCITGTLAVLSEEIVWLANPDVRATAPSDDAQPLGYDQILAAIAKQDPSADVEWLAMPEERHFALTAAVTYPDTRTATLYVNPYTGQVQGSSPLFNFRQFTRAPARLVAGALHQRLQLGLVPVSLLGLPMLASLVTGLVVYKRFWRGFLADAAHQPGRQDFLGRLPSPVGHLVDLVHRGDLHHRRVVPDPRHPRRHPHLHLQRRAADTDPA